MNQSTKDRIEEEEREWYERREAELSQQIRNRSDMHAQIRRELEDIRRNRNDD